MVLGGSKRVIHIRSPSEYDQTDSDKHTSRRRRCAIRLLLLFILVDVVVLVYFVCLNFGWPRLSELGLLFRIGSTSSNGNSNNENLSLSLQDQNLPFILPHLSAQISRAEKSKVFNNTLSPSMGPWDRRLKISNTIHTISQFTVPSIYPQRRTCTFGIRLPNQDASSSSSSTTHDFFIKDTRGTIRLDLCELESTQAGGGERLDARLLSWVHRPRCLRWLGTLDARVGEERRLEGAFWCVPGREVAVEVECAVQNEGCGLDVWSGLNGLGLVMYQLD